jgi:hypothetical protein
MSEVPISRRKVIGAGIATGLALSTGQSNIVMAKVPWKPEDSPEYDSAFDFVIKQNWRAGPGYWAVIYAGDSYTGQPTLIGEPRLMPKPQAGTIPVGWGAQSGSIVVGSSAVLRLFHKVDGQDTHITLLPFEQLAKVDALKITDGQSSWKLYPAGELRPPY